MIYFNGIGFPTTEDLESYLMRQFGRRVTYLDLAAIEAQARELEPYDGIMLKQELEQELKQ